MRNALSTVQDDADFLLSSFSPGQYAAVCGPKDGMKQGEIKGALGELGYDNDHVFKF